LILEHNGDPKSTPLETKNIAVLVGLSLLLKLFLIDLLLLVQLMLFYHHKILSHAIKKTWDVKVDILPKLGHISKELVPFPMLVILTLLVVVPEVVVNLLVLDPEHGKNTDLEATNPTELFLLSNKPSTPMDQFKLVSLFTKIS